jgi:hypothetical protein
MVALSGGRPFFYLCPANSNVMRFREFIFLPFFLFFFLTSPAQRKQKDVEPDQPLRIEIPAKSDNETYRLITCDSTGAILFFKSLEIVEEIKTRWYFSFYDRDLQSLWVKSVPLLSTLDFRLSVLRHDTLTLLFTGSGKSKGTEPAIQILRVILRKGSFILNSTVLPANTEVTFFGSERGMAWLGLQSKSDPGQLLFLNMNKGSRQQFALGKGSYILMRWMSVDTTGLSVRAVVSRQVTKKLWEHYLVRYDTVGNIRNEVLVTPGNTGYDLTNFEVCKREGGSEMIFGAYAIPSSGSGQKMKVIEESSGLFSCIIENGAQKETNFANYLELKSVNNLLSEKDILSLKKKALKKNKNIGEYSLDFTMILHKITRWKDNYLLLTEFYYPQYRTENYTDFDYYGRPYSNSYSVFDGYRYTNALVAAFDRNGKVLWDNTMEIRNLVSFELDPKVTIFPAGDDLVLSYLSDGKIASKIIHESNVVEKIDFSPVDLMYTNDKLLGESRSRMVRWYGNYFLCYGYQEIKNIALDKNNKRLVFYLNKIRFER